MSISKKQYLCATTVLLHGVLFASSATAALIINHSGQTDPTTESWVLAGTGGVGGFDTEDHLNMSPLTGERGNYEDNAILTAAHMTDVSGWTATMRVKATTDADGIFQIYAEVSDNVDVWYMNIRTDAPDQGFYWNHLTGNLLGANFDPSLAYHDYQMVYDPAGDSGSGLVTFYLDGNPVGTNTRAQAGNQAAGVRMIWGDNNGNASGATNANYAQVRFETGQHPVPEPASLALLGIGLVGCLMRRRPINRS